jgi:DNA-binding transcriptional LysR family regulator
MELRQLRYFVAVADTLNFSRASEILYVSQSALSKQIAELEEELNVMLFDRGNRTVSLTYAGQLLLAQAKSILIQSEKIAPMLRRETSLEQVKREIHIGTEIRVDNFPLIHRVLTEAVYRQRRNIPGLRALFWSQNFIDLRKALLGSELDLGVFLSAEEAISDQLESQVLFEDEMVLVFRSSKKCSDNRQTLLDILAKRGVILIEKETHGMSQILRIFDAIGSAPSIRLCGSFSAMLLTVESGESTAILPVSMLQTLDNPNLSTLHFNDDSARIYLVAAWRKNDSDSLPKRIAHDSFFTTPSL